MLDYIMSNVFRIDGEIALVTGGGTGIGLAMSKCFIESGAQVVITGRREEKLQEAVAELGSSSAYVVGDVCDLDNISHLASDAESRFGPISILANNAGINLKKPMFEVTDQQFIDIMNTSVTGAYSLTRSIAPGMVHRKHGSILFTASMASLMGLTFVSAYAAAKTAQLGLVRTLSGEFAQHGVRVNAVAPGFIYSAMTDKALNTDPERKHKILSRIQTGQMGRPEDIGWAAVYLCSPAAKYVTGVCLPIDGGFSAGF